MSNFSRKMRRSHKPEMETPQRRGPLRATGFTGPTGIQDRYVFGPCDYIDGEIARMGMDATQILYGAVAAARTLATPSDRGRLAIQEILVSSAAIAATEGEAFFTLCSIDLCAPAMIHARTIGEIARRFMVLPKYPDDAISLYEALEPARKQLVSKVDKDHPMRSLMEPFYAEVDGKTMEQLERQLYAKDPASDISSDYERKALSKWNHADIVALADAGDRLLNAGARVRTALVLTNEANVTMHRAAMGLIIILHVMQKLFGIEIGRDVDALIERLNATSERFGVEAAQMRAQAERVVQAWNDR